MYQEHFHLKALPFSLTPNTAFFCNLSGHQDALNVLLFSLKTGEGFIKITGEVGAGKTLLCRTLLNQLSDPFITAYIPNPDLDPKGFRLCLAQELGIDISQPMESVALLHKINERLISLHREGKRPVVIVDEAQALSDECLEALRLLTNLETESTKLLQIVLFGQPELDQRLKKSHLRQLLQRITFSYYLSPIPQSDLQAYLSHRLTMAGYTKGCIFDPQACELLYQASQGVPRIINILSHKALLVAFGLGHHMVTVDAMQQAVADSQDIIKLPTLHKVASSVKSYKWAVIVFVAVVVLVTLYLTIALG